MNNYLMYTIPFVMAKSDSDTKKKIKVIKKADTPLAIA